MSSYRGVRFNYVCRTGRAYWALLFCPLLLIIGLYVALIILLSIGSGFGSINAISLMVVLTLMLAVPAFAAVNGIISALQHDLYVNNLFFGRTPFIAELKKSAFIKFALIGLLIIPAVHVGCTGVYGVVYPVTVPNGIDGYVAGWHAGAQR